MSNWPERQDELVDPNEDRPLVCPDCDNEWSPLWYGDPCPWCETEESNDARY